MNGHRIMVQAADEAKSYDEQSDAIRQIASSALAKLKLLLREATTPGQVAQVLSALVDAQRLAKQSKEESDVGAMSDEQLREASGK